MRKLGWLLILVIFCVSCGRPAATPTIRPSATRVQPPTPTIDPTIQVVLSTRQAISASQRQRSCDQLAQFYREVNKPMKPNQDPEITVIEILTANGYDPNSGSYGGEFLAKLVREAAIGCRGN